MTQWQSEALVLAAEPRAESDLMVRLLTPGQGRLIALAKGALRSRERFLGALDPPRIIAAGFATTGRSGRLILEFADVREPFPEFRRDPSRLARAAILTELAELTVAETGPAEPAYGLITRGLRRLHAEPDGGRWAIVYAYLLLSLSGYRPSLDHCARCHRPIAPAANLFSPAAGGLICAACLGLPYPETGLVKAEAIPVTVDAVRTLLTILAAPEDRLPRIQFTRAARAQALDILNPFIAFHLGRPLRSLQFLEGLAG